MTTDEGVRAILAAGAAGEQPDSVTVDGDELALVYALPDGYRTSTVDLEAIRRRYAPYPEAKAGNYGTRDADSFLAYFLQHQVDGQVWADPPLITGVLDAQADGPTWERHRVQLQLILSPEWRVWVSNSGAWMDQETFAEFLEAHRTQIVDPVAADILEVAQSLQAKTSVDFKSGYRTKDGQRALVYTETTTAKAGQKGELEIPDHIVLKLRVYRGELPVEVVARFRYRILEGSLQLSYVIDRQEETLELADLAVIGRINQAITKADPGLGPVLIGTPAGAR